MLSDVACTSARLAAAACRPEHAAIIYDRSTAEAARVVVRGPSEAVVRASEPDLRAAGNIADFSFEYAAELTTEVTLADAVASLR